MRGACVKQGRAPDVAVCVSPGRRFERGISGQGRHILITAVSVVCAPLSFAVAAVAVAVAVGSVTLLFGVLRHIIFQNPPERMKEDVWNSADKSIHAVAETESGRMRVHLIHSAIFPFSRRGERRRMGEQVWPHTHWPLNTGVAKVCSAHLWNYPEHAAIW